MSYRTGSIPRNRAHYHQPHTSSWVRYKDRLVHHYEDLTDDLSDVLNRGRFEVSMGAMVGGLSSLALTVMTATCALWPFLARPHLLVTFPLLTIWYGVPAILGGVITGAVVGGMKALSNREYKITDAALFGLMGAAVTGLFWGVFSSLAMIKLFGKEVFFPRTPVLLY